MGRGVFKRHGYILWSFNFCTFGGVHWISCGKICLNSDPIHEAARIVNMYTQAKPQPQPRASSAQMAYVRPKTTTKDAVLQKKTDTKHAEWVDHMIRLRDHKDKAAFADLFHHFAPRVKAFLMKGGASAAMAEDITQEVMATLWTKAHMFDPARASVSTWIFTIARNRKIDVLRKQKRPEPEDLPWMSDYEPDQEDVFAMAQEAGQLARAVAELPEKQKQLVERAFYGDLSHSEIALETGLPLGTIKSRIRLALDRLRHAMT